jgi:hypothetical protein
MSIERVNVLGVGISVLNLQTALAAIADAVRQIRIGFGNLSRLDTQPTLWRTTNAERWGALDDAAHNWPCARLDDAHKNPCRRH